MLHPEACNEARPGRRNTVNRAAKRSLLPGVWYDRFVMAIPNVKRFRPFCTTCNESFTVMAVIPRDANQDAYLADVVARHDHKAFQDAKSLHTKVRVGQQKQKKAK